MNFASALWAIRYSIVIEQLKQNKYIHYWVLFYDSNPPFLVGTILKSELENLEDDFSRREMGLLLATTM